MPLLLGLDVGTQGARAVCCDELGHVIAEAGSAFDGSVSISDLPKGYFEQRPQVWWMACMAAIGAVIEDLKSQGCSSAQIAAIAVDSTSGTILPVDSTGNPLRPAIMYNDSRSSSQSAECNRAGSDFTAKIGYRFGSSFALPKILWIKENEPQVYSASAKIIHAADYIVSKLTGDFSISDNSNALKTGYDLVDDVWPDFISSELGIDSAKLPEIVRPGKPIGTVNRQCAQQTGLAEGTSVVSGASDGAAGFFASGASEEGQWNSTIGTTLVIRGISPNIISDPLGRIYCHRHPDGPWLPGGASNIGGECLTKRFAGENLAELDKQIALMPPTGAIMYPLERTGERLPFLDPDAAGFTSGRPLSGTLERYAACLEGVAYAERWCFDLMEDLGANVGNTIFVTGGGAKSEQWMRIRASVLNKTLMRPVYPQCVMGAAIAAGAGSLYSSFKEATKAMVSYDLTIAPDGTLSAQYDALYHEFRAECSKRYKNT